MKTSPGGKTVGYTSDSTAGQVAQQAKTGMHMPQSSYDKSAGIGGGTNADSSGSITPISSNVVSYEIDQNIDPNTPEGDIPISDRNAAGIAVARGVTDTYSWRSHFVEKGVMDTPNGPYGSIITGVNMGEGKERGAELRVENSFAIKDELKARGYKYGDGSWSKYGYANDLKPEVAHLEGKGITSKFGQPLYSKTHENLLGPGVAKEIMSTGNPKESGNKIAVKIQNAANSYGVKQNG